MTVTDVRDDLKAPLQSTIERDAPALTRFAEDIADHPELGFREERTATFIAACTDAGDLSHILPVLHPNHGGYVGGNHTAEFAVSDATDAYITPAKAMAGTLVDLLSNRAERALGIIRAFKPELTPDAYLAKMRAFTTKERFVYD